MLSEFGRRTTQRSLLEPAKARRLTQETMLTIASGKAVEVFSGPVGSAGTRITVLHPSNSNLVRCHTSYLHVPVKTAGTKLA